MPLSPATKRQTAKRKRNKQGTKSRVSRNAQKSLQQGFAKVG